MSSTSRSTQTRQRRKVSCTSCRQKKIRCNRDENSRPICSPCAQTLSQCTIASPSTSRGSASYNDTLRDVPRGMFNQLACNAQGAQDANSAQMGYDDTHGTQMGSNPSSYLDEYLYPNQSRVPASWHQAVHEATFSIHQPPPGPQDSNQNGLIGTDFPTFYQYTNDELHVSSTHCPNSTQPSISNDPAVIQAYLQHVTSSRRQFIEQSISFASSALREIPVNACLTKKGNPGATKNTDHCFPAKQLEELVSLPGGLQRINDFVVSKLGQSCRLRGLDSQHLSAPQIPLPEPDQGVAPMSREAYATSASQMDTLAAIGDTEVGREIADFLGRGCSHLLQTIATVVVPTISMVAWRRISNTLFSFGGDEGLPQVYNPPAHFENFALENADENPRYAYNPNFQAENIENSEYFK
ncbi:hypothetical protein V866_006363 [Kwoniella sp. B9012]